MRGKRVERAERTQRHAAPCVNKLLFSPATRQCRNDSWQVEQARGQAGFLQLAGIVNSILSHPKSNGGVILVRFTLPVAENASHIAGRRIDR